MKKSIKFGLLSLIVLATHFIVSSCNKVELVNYISPERDYFGWTLEYEVNGKKIEAAYMYDPMPGLHISMPVDYFTFRQERYRGIYSGRIHSNGRWFYAFDYSKLAYNVFNTGLFLHVVGPGEGRFKDNQVYSSPKDIVLYHPALLSDFASGSLDWDKLPTFNGFEVKILSSSFRFVHSTKLGVGKVQNLYFAFEEVITAVPEVWAGNPTVGDTLRITNGHMVHLTDELDNLVFE